MNDRALSEYERWNVQHGCTHGHCPCACDHPQPVLLADGRFVCGACLVMRGKACEMNPCVPATCRMEK